MGLFSGDYILLVLLPGMIIGGIAQARVRSAFAKAKKIRVQSGLSGAEAAQRILESAGLHHVGIERAKGWLGDHYDPRQKVLRLSPDVYDGRTIAAVGIAAHEAGHALQDQLHYAPLKIRNAIVPLASVGTNLSWVFLIAGMFLEIFNLMLAGVVLFSVVVFFQIINLPVEFNASTRARQILLTNGIIAQDEDRAVARVLNAAAMTYVAATITAILQLVWFLLRSGILGGRR